MTSYESLPVIKVPKYLTTTLNKVRHNEQKKVDKFKTQVKQNLKQKSSTISGQKSSTISGQKFDKNICIISSNNKSLNHYFGQTYRKTNEIPLISKEWMNGRLTNGMN